MVDVLEALETPLCPPPARKPRPRPEAKLRTPPARQGVQSLSDMKRSSILMPLLLLALLPPPKWGSHGSEPGQFNFPLGLGIHLDAITPSHPGVAAMRSVVTARDVAFSKKKAGNGETSR